jgi:hypothetical protein
VSVGFTATKADLDARAGQLAMGLRDALSNCARFCDLLNDTSIFANDAALTALGYTQAEVTVLRAAFTDLKALYTLSRAGATQPAANDFFFNAKHLTGVV